MQSLKSQPFIEGRLQSIDALRGVAALGVVLYHSLLQTQNALPGNFLRWPVKLLQFVSSFGYIGVFLFFVISGFCIHLQWAKSRANQQPQSIQFGSFWKRRIRRLYPPYLIAFALFMIMAALTTGINVTHFFVYDIVMHLLMLHNLDPNTCYSINGVFWTLAIEEQLYLAYFLLLFLRKRWGWGPTLAICALARVLWFLFSHAVWITAGQGIPVPEAAASHWFTWALGAIAVEAAFGLVTLPKWCRNLWIAAAAIVVASVVSVILPVTQKDTLAHDLAWMLMHPIWGLGFFIVVNRAVQAEHAWLAKLRRPRIVTAAATVGVFSYSLYLTHELVIMQSWWFVIEGFPPILNTLLIVVPATVAFAWLFYRFCEKPYLRKSVSRIRGTEEHRAEEPTPVFVRTIPPLADEA
ncbi:MAG: acyltransferase [Acidobacteriota bacterium]|nr:acyltransferase [Acidobacteriota bacterium]